MSVAPGGGGTVEGGPAEGIPFKREMVSNLPNLRAFAVSLIGSPDRADDLVQDAIMKAWAKQESFTPGTNMKACPCTRLSTAPSTCAIFAGRWRRCRTISARR